MSYDDMSRAELVARLEAAEKVCGFYAWTPSGGGGTDRHKALFQLWTEWRGLVPRGFVSPHNHPELRESEVGLAAERSSRVWTTLERIRQGRGGG